MPLPAALDFAKDPSASPARMNLAMAHLDGRLRALEVLRADVDAMLSQLQEIGLQRVNDALQPYYRALTAIVSLGILTNATSTTPVPIGLGRATFILSDADRDRFAFTGFMQAVSAADTRNALIGRFAAYDRTTGVLAIDVMVASGDGDATPADWMIMPSSPPFVPLGTIAAGDDDSPDLTAVPYVQATPDLASVLAALPTSSAGLLPGEVYLNSGLPSVVQP